MPSDAAPKAKRKSTSGDRPAKKARKSTKAKVESDSDVVSNDDRDATPTSAASDSEEDVRPKKKATKSKGKGAGKKEAKGKQSKAKETKSKAKRRKSKGDDSSDESEYAASDASEEREGDHDYESDESDGGVRVRVVRDVMQKKPAPKENAETPIILPTTFDFLARLAKNNDRDWFKARGAYSRRGSASTCDGTHLQCTVMRRCRIQVRDETCDHLEHALLNFNTFIKAWIPLATEADWQLPHLPAKDVVHWIYRDVSKDKTPYKTYFCANHSRTGRKGPFAGYYLHLSPNGKSFLGCGIWSPSTDGLKAIRDEILRNPAPLRHVLAEPAFIEKFGSDKPNQDGSRTSIFGHSDQLKNAPKLPGVDKTHKDIDLLKCRSFAVETKFTDDEVLSEDFLQTVKAAMETAVPFVHQINEMIMPTPASENEDANGEGSDAGTSAGEPGSEGESDEE
ncbi:hypothetical protein BMF94_5156 [Rhodotorula taiwanensis]|uniref:TIGR02453 family protein n=1 Tax=Rhodotorula taiwanensis TaxID=741276 RepID=A0A2S5B4Y2_9BASI|nr:hypothetical protein BMF94_5156 [Rhodotorula taiwanensis]